MFSPVNNFYKHSQNDTVSLEHLNEELWELHIPAAAFVLVCVVLGLFGNSLVVYIYRKEKFRRSNHRYFILCLAFMDLIGCVIGGSHMTYSLRMPYMMTFTAICKISRYFHHLVNQGSAFLLVVIAIERFNKLCRPFKRQITRKQTLSQCIFSIGFSAIVSVPAAILYGNSSIETGVSNITGTTCFITDEYRNTIFSKIFMIYLLLETVIVTLIIGILYTFIIKKIWTYRNLAVPDAMLSESVKKIAELENDKACLHSFEDSDYNSKRLAGINQCDTDIKINDDNETDEKNVIKNSNDNEVLDSKRRRTTAPATNKMTTACTGPDSINIADMDRVKDCSKTCSNSSATKHEGILHETAFCNSREKHKSEEYLRRLSKEKLRKRSLEAIRVTVMLFLITLVFCISVYPHLVLILLTINDETFLDNLTASEVVVFQVFLRIFVINSFANPIIYMFCDAKFRTYSARLFRRLFSCVMTDEI